MPAAAWVAPCPTDRESSTITEAPRRASSYAMEAPTIPAPMTATSQSPIILYHLTQNGCSLEGTVSRRKTLKTQCFQAFFHAVTRYGACSLPGRGVLIC